LPIVAVIDACVLFKWKVTDFLLNLADLDVFEPIWSDDINDEWMRNLHSAMNIPVEKIEYRKRKMESAHPAANCPSKPEVLLSIIEKCKNDAQRKDAHVIGTAVSSGATLIVTDNIGDFPQNILDTYGIRKLRPDNFCVELFELFPAAVIDGARRHRATLRRTSPDVDEYLSFLARNKDLSDISALLAQSGGPL